MIDWLAHTLEKWGRRWSRQPEPDREERPMPRCEKEAASKARRVDELQSALDEASYANDMAGLVLVKELQHAMTVEEANRTTLGRLMLKMDQGRRK